MTTSLEIVHSNPHTLLLTSHGLSRKVRKLVLILKLTQESKNAMGPHEVRLQKGSG